MALEVLAVPAFVLLALPYAKGTASGLVFVAGALFVAAWAMEALHAERRARRRLAPFVSQPPRSAAAELLWLAPAVVVGATAFWSLTGPGTSPDDLLADYVDLWRSGRSADATTLFAVPADPHTLDAAWRLQSARLANDIVTAAAEAGPNGGISAVEPWNAVRWETPAEASAGTTVGSAESSDARRVVDAVVVRRESVRDTFFGLVPTTTVRLVPVTQLGTIRLRTVELPGPFGGAPAIVTWRIAGIDLLGESLGGS